MGKRKCLCNVEVCIQTGISEKQQDNNGYKLFLLYLLFIPDIIGNFGYNIFSWYFYPYKSFRFSRFQSYMAAIIHDFYFADMYSPYNGKRGIYSGKLFSGVSELFYILSDVAFYNFKRKFELYSGYHFEKKANVV